MNKTSKIICLEIFFIVLSLLMYSIQPFINPTMNLFISNLGIIFYVLFLIFLLFFGIIYTAKNKEPRLLLTNILLFIVYLISPFIISHYFHFYG